MSVLNYKTQSELSSEEKNRTRANRINSITVSSSEKLINGITKSLSLIWESDDPQGVLDALGTDAKELFEINTETLNFLTTVLAGKRDEDLEKIAEKVAKILPHTIHEDGTVTIDEVV